jgi:hypothetical protein
MTTRYRRPDVRQEEDDLPWRRILLLAAAIITLLVMLVLWAASLLRGTQAELRPSGRFPERDLGPRGEVSGIQQRLFMEKTTGEAGPGTRINRNKRRDLSSFGWVDKERGVVSIPIDDAMELVAGEGGRPR